MKNKTVFVVLFLYAVLATLTIIFFDGIGHSGDSIHHYLYAKFAPNHPELYFNHWAKPLHVLLASPFAQFGLVGMKVFNVLVSLLTIFFTYKIAQAVNLKNAIVVTVLLIFSPLYFVLTFTGLTEPLFALFVSIGIYAVLKNKYIIACLVISFLPFIRSEGLIIIGVFGFFLLLKKEWKIIPLLLFGHLAYSLAGFVVYNDLMWVFNKIPYAKLGSTYGSGKLFHYVEQLLYVIGIPIYILFWIGFISLTVKSIKKTIALELKVLVLLGFLAFFIAHSLFWYLGIFNSMGLKRVFLGIVPILAIIALMGYNFITEELLKNKKKVKVIFQWTLVLYVVVFPFTSNPAAINWERDLSISTSQKSAHEIADYIAQDVGLTHRFVFSNPYLSEALQIDHFDSSKRMELMKTSMSNIKSGDIIIWENWFAVVEYGVTKEHLDSNTNLINIHNVIAEDEGRKIHYSIYKQK